MGKKSNSGSGMIAQIIFFRELRNIFELKFFDADPDPGSGIFLNMDPGSWIRDGKN
jgi:hypothetical protein